MKTKARAGMTRKRKVAKRVNRQDLTLRNLHAMHRRFDELRILLDRIYGEVSKKGFVPR